MPKCRCGLKEGYVPKFNTEVDRKTILSSKDFHDSLSFDTLA